jgi:hypothetical protein
MIEWRRLAHHPGATTTDLTPSAEEIAKLALTHVALGALGVGSSAKGYDMTSLAAAVYARGWTYDIDRVGSDYRATVSQSSRELGQFHAIGFGWSIEAALAYGLEKAFETASRRNALAGG